MKVKEVTFKVKVKFDADEIKNLDDCDLENAMTDIIDHAGVKWEAWIDFDVSLKEIER